MEPNHESAAREFQFVTEAIEELIACRCVQVVANQPHICSPLSVAVNSSGKRRLVLNLHYLNRFLWKQTCKYEDLQTVMMLFRPEDYMFTFDLKSRYHHLDIIIQ